MLFRKQLVLSQRKYNISVSLSSSLITRLHKVSRTDGQFLSQGDTRVIDSRIFLMLLQIYNKKALARGVYQIWDGCITQATQANLERPKFFVQFLANPVHR